jgi:transcriptional regulator with XRE-family HTH domain
MNLNERRRRLQEEQLKTEILELIHRLMKKQGVSKTELAQRLGKKERWMTSFLRGDITLTIRVISDVFFVLGQSLHVTPKNLMKIKSILDGVVEEIIVNEHGAGKLHLQSQVESQSILTFKKAPKNIISLTGLNIWGDINKIMLGNIEIATRQDYVFITFHNDEIFEEGLSSYNG